MNYDDNLANTTDLPFEHVRQQQQQQQQQPAPRFSQLNQQLNELINPPPSPPPPSLPPLPLSSLSGPPFLHSPPVSPSHVFRMQQPRQQLQQQQQQQLQRQRPGRQFYDSGGDSAAERTSMPFVPSNVFNLPNDVLSAETRPSPEEEEERGRREEEEEQTLATVAAKENETIERRQRRGNNGVDDEDDFDNFDDVDRYETTVTGRGRKRRNPNLPSSFHDENGSRRQNTDNDESGGSNSFLSMFKNNVLKKNVSSEAGPSSEERVRSTVLEAERMYLVRVVRHMLKGNTFCGNMFHDFKYEECSLKDVKHMISFMIRSSRVEEANALSKSTLNVTYGTLVKVFETAKRKLPFYRSLIDGVIVSVRDSYDRTVTADYKMNSLIRFVAEEERASCADPAAHAALEQTSMMSDFFKGMFFPGMVALLGELMDKMVETMLPDPSSSSSSFSPSFSEKKKEEKKDSAKRSKKEDVAN